MIKFFTVTFIFGGFNWKTFVYETADKHTMIVAAHDEDEAKELFRTQSQIAYGRKKITVLRVDPYTENIKK